MTNLSATVKNLLVQFGYSIKNIRNAYKNEDYKQVERDIKSSESIENLNDRAVVIFSMVRDEGDILEIWLENIERIGAQLFVVDHKSKDQTTEKLKNHVKSFGGAYYRMNTNGYFQLEAMRFLLKRAKKLIANQATVLIPLDADEFISVRAVREIRRLTSLGNKAVALRWRNAIVGLDQIQLKQEGPLSLDLRVASSVSPIWKSATLMHQVRSHGLNWAQGNHLLHDFLGRWVNPTFSEDAEIIHIPIRSLEQLETKLNIGILEYQARKKKDGNGFHWQEMADVVYDQNFPIETLVGNYGMRLDNEFATTLTFTNQNLHTYLLEKD